MLYIHLTPGIVLPALWASKPEDVADINAVVRNLNSMAEESLMDAGGWGNLVERVEYLGAGDRPTGMVMDIRATVASLIERASTEGRSEAEVALVLGVDTSTLHRWRTGVSTPFGRLHRNGKGGVK